MTQPPILVVSHDAAEYVPMLAEQMGSGMGVCTATKVKEAVEVYQGQTIVLGEPDLLAGALDRMPAVQWVQSSWAGVTPLLNCGRRDYLLTNIKDTFGPQMAEYVFAYLLAREVRILERLGHQSNRTWWEGPSGSVEGKTLGVMGTGSIGRDIAKIAGSFGTQVLGFSRTGCPVSEFDRVYAGDQLAEFLPQLDYLVAALPDTPGTRHLIGAEAFTLMKSSCYLVNVGRGPLIDEQALVKALYADELSGAVLDVFDTEPLAEDSPLWHTPNLLVTGHISGMSRPTDIVRIFSDNYRKFCNGEELNYLVDFDRGY